MLYPLFTAVIVSIGLLSPAVAQSAPDTSGKVVLANLDRYDAILRVGKTRREIKPKKASYHRKSIRRRSNTGQATRRPAGGNKLSRKLASTDSTLNMEIGRWRS